MRVQFGFSQAKNADFAAAKGFSQAKNADFAAHDFGYLPSITYHLSDKLG